MEGHGTELTGHAAEYLFKEIGLALPPKRKVQTISHSLSSLDSLYRGREGQSVW